jgi:predicted nucleic acid-binding protein
MAGMGLLVDTSFLIAFGDPSRSNHSTANDIFNWAIKEKCPLYLSALVVTEFAQKQAIETLGIHNYIMAPFNIPEAILAARMGASLKHDEGDDRVALKVDIMLIAQAEKLGVSIVTDDHKTMDKYCVRLRNLSLTTVRTIVLRDGFDPHGLKDPTTPGLTLKETAPPHESLPTDPAPHGRALAISPTKA